MTNESITVQLHPRLYDLLLQEAAKGPWTEEDYVSVALKTIFRLTKSRRERLLSLDAVLSEHDSREIARGLAVVIHRDMVLECAGRAETAGSESVQDRPPVDDAVIRMLADLDYHPETHTTEDIERRIAEASNPGPAPKPRAKRSREPKAAAG